MTDNDLLARFRRGVNALALEVHAEVWDHFKREADAVAAALRARDTELAVARTALDDVRGLHQADETGQLCLHDGFTWPCRTAVLVSVVPGPAPEESSMS